jgi:hypothetical protein
VSSRRSEKSRCQTFIIYMADYKISQIRHRNPVLRIRNSLKFFGNPGASISGTTISDSIHNYKSSSGDDMLDRRVSTIEDSINNIRKERMAAPNKKSRSNINSLELRDRTFPFHVVNLQHHGTCGSFPHTLFLSIERMLFSILLVALLRSDLHD